ncbi:hypothetical protein KEM55_005131 [Ascosphaera atra]|nr:hypothetical protein KEM55_005131 [Ascosphaera atra]
MASSGPGPGKDNTIKVVARFRPQNKVELASGGEPIVEFETEDTCRINAQTNPSPSTASSTNNAASKTSSTSPSAPPSMTSSTATTAPSSPTARPAPVSPSP